MQVPYPKNSEIIILSRGLEVSLGNDAGCSKATKVDAIPSSAVNGTPMASLISRGSEYEKCTSEEFNGIDMEKSPLFEESVNEPSSTADTRHLATNENSLNEPIQDNGVPSPNHLPITSVISSSLIKLLSPNPELLEHIVSVSTRAELEWARGIAGQFVSDNSNRLLFNPSGRIVKAWDGTEPNSER
jgi:hypothetical protein